MRLKSVIAFFLLSMFVLSAQEHPSIHQFDLEAHQGVVPQRFYSAVRPVIRATQETKQTPIITEKMFGYLPYWANKTDNIKYSLMTDILYFSCELSTKGTLGNCHNWPAAAPIAEAHQYGVKMHLTITAFDKDRVVELITSSAYTTAFYETVYDKVHSAGADGVNLDFEFSSGDNSTDLASFVNGLADYFHSQDAKLKVSLAIPAVDWGHTFDLTAMDKADYFFVMAYDYHWKGGEPGPVAPLYSHSPWTSGGICVERSVDTYLALLGDTNKEKLIVGFPYYGYRWPSTSGDIPGTKTANATAAVYRSIVTDYTSYATAWDDGSKTPNKIYQNSGWQQLWFEDGDSLDLKYAFLQEKGVGGSGMWALNSDGIVDDLWQKIAESFSARGQGSRDNPIVVNNFPFGEENNTYYWFSDNFDTYECDRPDTTSTINEEGPEVVYKVSVKCPGILHLSLPDGGGAAGAREDVDIHLLRTLDSTDCIVRDDKAFDEQIEPGDYFVVADTFVGDDGVRQGGAYSILIDFTADDGCEETTPDDDVIDDQDTISDNDVADEDSVEDSDAVADDTAVADDDDSAELSDVSDNEESFDEDVVVSDDAEHSDESQASSSEGCGCLIVAF